MCEIFIMGSILQYLWLVHLKISIDDVLKFNIIGIFLSSRHAENKRFI